MDIDAETALFYGFIGLLIVVVTTVMCMLFHSGFFTEISVHTCKPCIGEVVIAYKAARGPYKEAGSLFTEAHSLLPEYRTIGVYYDDPKKKEPNRLRYIVGLIISENGEPVKPEHEAILKEWDYKLTTFPSINHAVQTSFPFKSTISIIIAIFRVYPILDEYIEMRSLCAHPFIEVYDKKSIYFIGPLEKQDSFYVPEVLESEEKSQGEEEDEEEEHSSVSWDESASYIKSDGFDSDSLLDEGQLLNNDSPSGEVPSNNVVELHTEKLSENTHENFENTQENLDNEKTEGALKIVQTPVTQNQEAEKVNDASQQDEDSDNTTGSSFEEIDEKEAPEIQEEVLDSPQQKTTL